MRCRWLLPRKPRREVVGGGLEQVAGARGGCIALVLRKRPAQRHPAPPAQAVERSFEVQAADAVEVDVDSVGGRRAQQLDDGPAAIVEGGVEAQVLEQVADLLVGA